MGQKKYPLAFKDLESGLFKLFMLAAARVKVASTASMPTGPIGEISIEGLGFAKSLLLCLSIKHSALELEICFRSHRSEIGQRC